MALVACDVSYFQPAVTDAYPHRWLIFRCCDGDFADPNCDHNAAWSAAAVRAGRMVGWTAYVVYRPGKNQAILNHVDGLPAGGHVMIDVERWGGQITGNHTSEIQQLAAELSRTHPGRVWVYGNQGDLATIDPGNTYPVVIASYGATKPNHPNMVGWQYTDGSWAIPGKPNVTPPFGACDHNELYLDAESVDSGNAHPINSTPKPTPITEDDDMGIIWFDRLHNAYLYLNGGRVKQILKPKTLVNLRAAGVKTVEVDPADFGDALKNWK